MAGNTDFDALVSSTMKKYAPKFTDNIFSNLPFLYWLRSGDRIEKVDGGEKLVEPLMYGTNSTAGSYAGYDDLDLTPQEGITAAEYPWRQFAVTVAISGIEEAKNNGPSAVFSLLKAKITQAELSAEEELDSMFITSVGTGNSSKDWYGLAYFIPDDPTTGTVGGINRATSGNEWWRPQVSDSAVPLTINAVSHQNNLCTKGNDKPDLHLTTQVLYEAYESLLQPHLRLTNTKAADAGFENLAFKSATLFYDDYVAAGDWYLLNSKYLKLKVHSKVWMSPSEFVKPPGQDAKYMQYLSYGNLVASNCRRQGKLASRTA